MMSFYLFILKGDDEEEVFRLNTPRKKYLWKLF